MSCNVRVVAATHRNLEKHITDGKFREDLFYRLNVFPIEMPKLSERLDDLPLLVNELITRLEHEKNASVRLTRRAILALSRYHWPGNVRELANFIERLSILHPMGVVDVNELPENIIGHQREKGDSEQDETISPERVDDIPINPVVETDVYNAPRLPRDGLDLKQHLTNIEISLIQQALDETGGVVARAAERLQIRRTTLVEKMRKYEIHRTEELP